MERGYKVKDLEVNHQYWCNLSKRVVLVTNMIEKEYPIAFSNEEKTYWEANCHAYSERNGYYESFNAFDNQLEDLPKQSPRKAVKIPK